MTAEPIKIRKSYNLDSPVINIIIALVCVLGIAVSLRFFRNDYRETLAQLSEKPIGSVYWVNNAAQRLSLRHGQWDRLERFSYVYDGDIISAAAVSEVKIHFTNGETLELSENTRIRIDYGSPELPRIELLAGEIEVQSDHLNMEISIEGTSVENSPVTANLAPRTGAAVKASYSRVFCLIQGAAEISSGGETRAAAAGTANIIANDGTFLPELPVIMLSPRNGTRIIRNARGSAPVKFLWQKTEAESGVVLEIAASADFSDSVGSWTIGDADSADIELAEGAYFWKIHTEEAPDRADSGRLDIFPAAKLTAISPANGSVETFYSGQRDLRFSWSVPEEAEAVLLEVAANPEMNRPRLRQLVKRTDGGYGSFVTSDLEAGKWFWRVHPVYLGGVSEGDSSAETGEGFWRVRPVNARIIADETPSEINEFTIKEDPAPRTKTPVSFVVGAEPGNVPRILFPYDSYTLETGRTPDLFFYWKNPLEYEASLQISTSSDFSGGLVADRKVFGSSVQSPFLKPGNYYWRVTGAGGNSEPTRLVIEPSLAAPTLTSPAATEENKNLHITEGTPVIFSWKREHYANYYAFRLFLEGRDSPLTEILSLENNAVQVFFDPRTRGSFYWTVQGFAAPTDTSSGRTGLISRGNFDIDPPASAVSGQTVAWLTPRITNVQTFEGWVTSPIVLRSPVSGINVPGMQALRNPMEARWTTEEPLTNLQLIVSKNQNPTDDPSAITINAGEASSITFPALTEGIWYWVIRGDTLDDRGAIPGAPSWINVLPIPLLPAPPANQPENDSIFGIAQLTRERKIEFSWNEIEGANAYIFSLFRASSGEAEEPPVLLLTSPPQNVYNYVLDNLSVLNEGNYLWQAEAIYQNEFGVIEQRGVIEQHAFAIQIQHSAGMETQGPGQAYGQ